MYLYSFMHKFFEFLVEHIGVTKAENEKLIQKAQDLEDFLGAGAIGILVAFALFR